MTLGDRMLKLDRTHRAVEQKKKYTKALADIEFAKRDNLLDKEVEMYYTAIINFYKSKLYDLRDINE